ncbi:RNA polymerase sigma factor RpoH [Candidatus Symbiobacter mobilis]|nr:RNA polymerase sigma factor RpoH [Candidatus Symbiobacter mobilis]
MSNTAIALKNPWFVVPALGNLDAYIAAVHRIPMLSLEEEQSLARRFREHNDLEAAGKLVLSHLRLVVSVARQYLGYGLPHADLIQEGNVGLMKAVKRFDPAQGVRLVSYALHWIKAEIHDYVLRNWRMVRVATTKAQRKLFFNLRSLKQRLKGQEMQDGGEFRDALDERQIDAMASELQVKREDVIEMEARMSASDVVLESTPTTDGDELSGPIAYLHDPQQEPTAILEARQRDALAGGGLRMALDTLDPRSRHIVEERWLQCDDSGAGGMTLHELARIYGVSAERIRQIEVAAMKKMRMVLARFV